MLLDHIYALTSTPLPPSVHGRDGEVSIRTLFDTERLAIEDFFFANNSKVTLDADVTAVILPQDLAGTAALEDAALMVEFGLAVISVSGFQPVSIVAAFDGSKCIEAVPRSGGSVLAPAPTFPRRLLNAAGSAWMRQVLRARAQTKDRLHIVADRFIRYSRSNDSWDALVDLCICLEALIESQTEISFRFAICLTKISQLKDPEAVSELLSQLYDLRSKVVHGADPSKEHRKIQPRLSQIRFVARAILSAYVLFLSEHTKDDWKKHLRRSPFL